MTKEHLAKVLDEHNAMIARWAELSRKGTHFAADKMQRAQVAVTDALVALAGGKIATAMNLLGFVQGTLYGVGMLTWERIQLINKG